MRKIEGLGQKQRKSLKMQGGGGRNGKALRVWQAPADLKCGFRATAMPTLAL